MARIGFLTLYATGHLGPSLALARALQRRGHQAVFFNLPDTRPAIAAAGVRFVPFAEAEYPTGSLRHTMQKTAELTGQEAFAHYVQRMVFFFDFSFRDLPAALREENLDLLIVDQVHYAGATLAEHVRVPFVTLANALLVNREDVIPPPILLWPFDTSPEAIARNRKGWAMVDGAYAPLLGAVNAQRDAWGLEPYRNLMEDSFSPLAQICQQPAFFEPPRPEAPPTLHFVGHLQDERPSSEDRFDWDWLDGRPLIYASCGTLQNRLEPVFWAMAEACAPLQAQTVIALGRDALSPDLFRDAPANVKFVTYAPQRALLQRASLCITHAGLNTALDCLQAGVPTAAIPLASEQPGIAMRLARLGAGVVVPLAELSADRLHTAVQTVLNEPSYREAAGAAATAMARMDAAGDAVALIERILFRDTAA